MDNMVRTTETDTRDRSWSGPPRLRSTDTSEDEEAIDTELLDRAAIRRVVVPSRVDPGEQFSIDGRIGMRSVFAGQRPVRVTIDAPWLSSPRTRRIGELGYNDEETFSFVFTAPNNPGATYDVTIIAEWRRTIGGWSQSDQTTRTIVTRVPPQPDTGSSGSDSDSDSGSGSGGYTGGSGSDSDSDSGSGGTPQPTPQPTPSPGSAGDFLSSLSDGEKAALAIGGVAVAAALMGGGGGGAPRGY